MERYLSKWGVLNILIVLYIQMYVYIFVCSKKENMETECFTQEELEKLAYVLKAVAHRIG